MSEQYFLVRKLGLEFRLRIIAFSQCKRLFIRFLWLAVIDARPLAEISASRNFPVS